MTIHIALLSIICLQGIVFYRNGVSKTKNQRFVALSFFEVLLVYKLRRWDIGLDTLAYITRYFEIKQAPIAGYGNFWEVTYWEPGYVLVNKIVGFLGGNQQFLLFVIGLIILFGIGVFICENLAPNETAFWPVFFFVTFNHYFTSMVSLRQYCALAIGINIYTVLKRGVTKKAFLKAIILLLVAMSFHTTSFVCVLFICSFFVTKIDRKIVVLSSIAAVSMFLLFNQIMQILFMLFPQYQRYQEGDHYKFAGGEFSSTYVVLMLIKLSLIGAAFFLNPKKERNIELYRMSIFSIVSIGISFMTTKVHLMWRFGYYFDVFLILLIGKTIVRIKSREQRIILYSISFLIGIVYFGYLMKLNNSGCIPYKFFWE